MPKRILVGPDGQSLQVDPATSARLGQIRQKDTAPERTVRSILARSGLRFTIRNRDLPGSPDLANRTRRWVIFVHGCFWHSHTGCSRATVPKRNRPFWIAKFEANKRRDRRVTRALRRQAYTVITVWECAAALKPEIVAARIKRALAKATALRAAGAKVSAAEETGAQGPAQD